MRYLSVLISALAALALISCDAGNPTSSRTRNNSDPAGKLIVSGARVGGYDARRAVTPSLEQGAFYAPYYGTDPTDPSVFKRLGKVDLQTGETAQLVPDFEPYHQLPYIMASAAFDVDGTLYTIINGMNISGQDPTFSQLAIIDMDMGEVIPIGAPNPINMIGLEIDARGRIYATGFDALPELVGDDHLYSIDRETGLATDIGPTGIELIMDLAIDAAGSLYATTDNILYRLDPRTGQVLSETPITGVPEQWFDAEGCDPDNPEGTPCTSAQSTVMSIAFGADGDLYGLSMVPVTYPLLEVHGQPHGAPLLRIDPETGAATLIAWTGQPNFHSGDIPPSPSQVTVCHRKGGSYRTIEISSAALPAHLSHGDLLPGPDGSCGFSEEAIYAPYLGTNPWQAFERLGKLDLRTGDVTEMIDSFGPDYAYPDIPVLVASAAFDVDGTLYTLINKMDFGDGSPTTSQLAIIDVDAGEIVPVGQTNPFNLTAMEIDGCGRIYAAGFNMPPFLVAESRLFTIDKETGLATPKASEMVNADGAKLETVMDLAFGPDGNLYGTVGNVLYTLDTGSGQVIDEVELTGVPVQRIVNGPEGWLCGDTPDAECDQPSEVMSIAFDRHGVLHAMSMVGNHLPLLEVDGRIQGAPLLEIDPVTGATTVVTWTGVTNFHGGDIPSPQGSPCGQ